VILRQRGEPEISLGDELYLNVKGTEVISDIFICWSYIHGYSHLRIEGQLRMVPEEVHRKIMRENAGRLSNFLQQREF
jgi:hypothetical protein